MLKNFIYLSSVLSIFTTSILADNSYNDVEYMIDKQRVRYTIENLENLKNKYDINSKEYKNLEKSQQFFVDKLPVDTFGTFTRMKLHNIIDNEQVVVKKKIPKYKMLNSDTDLDSLYNAQKAKEKNEIQLNKSMGVNPPVIGGSPFSSIDNYVNSAQQQYNNNRASEKQQTEKAKPTQVGEEDE